MEEITMVREVCRPATAISPEEGELRRDLAAAYRLAALFGIPGPAEPGPAPWAIEKYVGIHPAGSQSFPGYVPPSRTGTGTQAPPKTTGAV